MTQSDNECFTLADGECVAPNCSLHGSASQADELKQWWKDKAASEIDDMAAKAVEYSAYDLVLIGHVMGDATGKPRLSDEEATELACFFYLLGKVGRWAGAIRDGRRCSDDTLLDIGVYARMAQRNRAVGGWPNPREDGVE